MRIIYLHQYFNTPAMSGGTRSYEFAKRLVQNGHEVHVVTSWTGAIESDRWFQTSEDGITVHWLPVEYSNSMGYKERIAAFAKFAAFSAFRAASIPSDVIYATSTPLTISLPAIYASRRLKIPMVFEVRDLWPQLPIAMGALKSPLTIYLAKRMEKLAYKYSKAVVALSPGMRDGVVECGISEEQVSVIPNACDFDLFSQCNTYTTGFMQESRWVDSDKLMVYAGTLGKINGVGYLVDLAVALKDLNSTVCILVVGQGAEEEEIRERASNLGVLGRNFFMEKNVSKNDVAKIYSVAAMVCSLFIDLPEMRANSANKFFDGLAAGKPIFINYGGWHADLLEEYQCGIVAWNRDIGEAALLVTELLQDKDLVRKMSVGSYELGRSKFDRDELAQRLELVLTTAVGDFG